MAAAPARPGPCGRAPRRHRCTHPRHAGAAPQRPRAARREGTPEAVGRGGLGRASCRPAGSLARKQERGASDRIAIPHRRTSAVQSSLHHPARRLPCLTRGQLRGLAARGEAVVAGQRRQAHAPGHVRQRQHRLARNEARGRGPHRAAWSPVKNACVPSQRVTPRMGAVRSRSSQWRPTGSSHATLITPGPAVSPARAPFIRLLSPSAACPASRPSARCSPGWSTSRRSEPPPPRPPAWPAP
jgi:hypothetical protein